MSNINVREVIERYVAAIKERISRRVPWFKFNASGPYTNFHEENIDWVVKTVSDHENRITIAEATIDAHTEILENHEERIETCEHRLDEHDVILADHEERITQAEEDIDDLQDRMTNAENTLVNHETRIGGLEVRMTNAETTINQHTTEINSLKTRVTNVEGDIVDIKGDIVDIQGDIVDIQGDITTIQGDITNIEGDITNIQGDITNIEGDITNIEGDITNITNQIADLVEVEANPTGTATETLTKLRVDDTIYDIPQGGGSGDTIVINDTIGPLESISRLKNINLNGNKYIAYYPEEGPTIGIRLATSSDDPSQVSYMVIYFCTVDWNSSGQPIESGIDTFDYTLHANINSIELTELINIANHCDEVYVDENYHNHTDGQPVAIGFRKNVVNGCVYDNLCGFHLAVEHQVNTSHQNVISKATFTWLITLTNGTTKTCVLEFTCNDIEATIPTYAVTNTLT